MPENAVNDKDVAERVDPSCVALVVAFGPGGHCNLDHMPESILSLETQGKRAVIAHDEMQEIDASFCSNDYNEAEDIRTPRRSGVRRSHTI